SEGLAIYARFNSSGGTISPFATFSSNLSCVSLGIARENKIVIGLAYCSGSAALTIKPCGVRPVGSGSGVILSGNIFRLLMHFLHHELNHWTYGIEYQDLQHG